MKREHDTTSTGTVARPNQRRRSSKRKSNKNMPPIKMLNAAIDKRIVVLAEKKFKDTTATYNNISGTYPFDTGVIFLDLTEVANTSPPTDSTRIGDQILMNSIEVNYLLYAPATSAQAPRFMIRTTIFQWQTDDIPTISDLVEAGSATLENIISPWTHDTISIRKIYYNKVVTLFDSQSASTFRVNNNTFVEKQFIDLKKRPISERRIQYAGGGLTGSNHIWANICSSVPVGTQASAWNAIFKIRINYTDT